VDRGLETNHPGFDPSNPEGLPAPTGDGLPPQTEGGRPRQTDLQRPPQTDRGLPSPIKNGLYQPLDSTRLTSTGVGAVKRASWWSDAHDNTQSMPPATAVERLPPVR